jgi:hypothetical protein
MERKVGDIVTIRKDMAENTVYGNDFYNTEMLPYKGILAKITHVKKYCDESILNKEGQYYLLNIDKGYHRWTDEMFEDNNKVADIKIMFANGLGIKATKDNKDQIEFDANKKYRVINGKFKGIEGSILGIEIKTLKDTYARNFIVNIKVDDNNIIHINTNNIEEIYTDEKTKEILYDGYNKYQVEFKTRGKRTSIKLLKVNEKESNIKASVYCNKNDVYDKDDGKSNAFKKALAKKYQLDYEKAI